MPNYFTPPTRWERIPTNEKPYRFYMRPVAMNVVQRNGRFQEVRVATDHDDGLVEGETWFAGARTYIVSDELALLLQADGFDITTTGPIFGGG